MGEEYRHTQVGVMTIIMILLTAAITAFIFYSSISSTQGLDVVMLKVVSLVVAGIFVLTLASFYSFTIQIAEGNLNFWFGFGVSRKAFSIEGIRSVEIVKNPWYYFWGIKSIPGGWLYSIAPGGWAIELIFKDKKKIRLGTNCPEEIKQRLDKASGNSN